MLAVIEVLFMFVWLALIVFIVAGMWKTFEKGGLPGWGCLIPIYNVYLLMKLAGRPGWWLLLFFIPLVNLIIAVVTSIDVARNFGKGTGFGIGLAFLGFIFYPILGFGDAQYVPGAGSKGFPILDPGATR